MGGALWNALVGFSTSSQRYWVGLAVCSVSFWLVGDGSVVRYALFAWLMIFIIISAIGAWRILRGSSTRYDAVTPNPKSVTDWPKTICSSGCIYVTGMDFSPGPMNIFASDSALTCIRLKEMDGSPLYLKKIAKTPTTIGWRQYETISRTTADTP